MISAETADNEGQWATASVNVIFDNTPPEFASLTPIEAAPIFYEDGPLHMEAISDDVNPLSEVKFFANGLPQGEFDEAPYVADIEWEDVSEEGVSKIQFKALQRIGREYVAPSSDSTTLPLPTPGYETAEGKSGRDCDCSTPASKDLA